MYAIEEIETLWIPMPDGIRLAARVWMPQNTEPTPAIFEYIPYRKRDLVRARDEQNHPFFAAHGYVCLRVDMRGSGDSEGHMEDMYSEHELADARRVIEWIAAQPWCNGRVGMFGTSWGGTASLQAAVDAPVALRAVIANCATADRFEDDIHWMGGCVLTDTVEWGATLPAILAAPPDSATVGEQWRSVWEQRLARLSFPLDQWLLHSVRGDYWRHGSVIHQTEQLSLPVLAIGGWSDRYSNSVMKLVERRPDLCRGIVGPWGHHYPDKGEPGPAVNFQRLALSWWDHHLKGLINDVPQWPALQVWQRSFDPPVDRLPQRNGRWLQLNHSTPSIEKHLYLSNKFLTDVKGTQRMMIEVPVHREHGSEAGDTGYFGRTGGLPLEQSDEDSRSVVFDTHALSEPLSLFGGSVLELILHVSDEPGQMTCRLCDISPDGESNLITRTVRNLALDDALDAAHAPLQQAYSQSVRIELPTTAYRLPKGHKLRLALSRTYWPLAFPIVEQGPVFLSLPESVIKLSVAPVELQELVTALPDVNVDAVTPHNHTVHAAPLVRTPAVQVDGLLQCGWHQQQSMVEYHHIDTRIATECKVTYELQITGDTNACCTVDYAMKIMRPDGVADIHSNVSVQLLRSGWQQMSDITVKWNNEVLLDRSRKKEFPS